jgi:heptosyltransferase-2
MKILLVQTSYLGDTILSTPVIAGLKSAYPRADIWMMTTAAAADLVKRDPLLAGVLAYDKRNADRGIKGLRRMRRRIASLNFDVAYSLHRSYRTAILLRLCGIPVRIGFKDAKLSFLYTHTRARNRRDHDVLRNMAILGEDVSSTPGVPELRLFAPGRDEIHRSVYEPLQDRSPYIVLAPGSAWATKRWPWPYYRTVAEHVLAMGRAVVLVGAPSEKEVTDNVARGLPVVNLAGKTRIGDLMFVIRHAALVVCNDSMTLHLASAFKVPTVAIFCATSPEFGFGPWRNRAVVVQREDLSCKPCARHGGRQCPTGTEACMQGLTPDRVIKAAEQLLGQDS